MALHTPWLQQKLEAIWYNNNAPIIRTLLLPLSTLFCFLSQRKRNQQQKQQQPFSIPIIIVGNINIGGTGKTPLVIRLVELLKQNGYKPAIITRGYKGTSHTWPLSVDATTQTELAGDEAKLMAVRSKVPVIAGAKRVENIQYVLDNTDCNIIISDDGLQHYKMKRDIEIAVIDAQRRFGNGHCLPAGPLRELPKRLEECDFVITNGTNRAVNKEYSVLANESTMQVSGTDLINLSRNETKPLSAFKTVQVVTGIGNPQRFRSTLEAAGVSVIKQTIFPDHHTFTTSDFASLDKQTVIVMTEKDAVKCTQLQLSNSWYLPVDAQLEEQFETSFIERLDQLVSAASV